MVRLVYISSLIFPARYANQIQTLEMARAFSKFLGDAFLFVCPQTKCNELKSIPHYSISTGFLSRFPNIIVYCIFIFLPIFLILKGFRKNGVILYFKDTRLAAFAIFWKRLLFRKIRVVLEAHIPFPSIYERYAYTQVDLIVTLTQAMYEILQSKYGVSEKRILVCPDGVNMSEFDVRVTSRKAREMIGLPTYAYIALYCGSVGYYQWKGEDIFIDAAKYLEDNFLFVLVGGSEREAEKAYGKNLPSNVKCFGRISHAEIPFYLRAADVLILPNKKGNPRSESFTSPLKLFEYMASGVPIIASKLKSICEILDEDNAVLVEPNNSMALVKSIKRLRGNELLAKRVSNRAKTDVVKYQWINRATIILRFLDIN